MFHQIQGNSERGSSLLQVMVTLMAAGVFLASFLVLLNPLIMFNQDVSASVTTESEMDDISQAFSDYVEKNLSLPCPAPMAAGQSDPDYARAVDCLGAVGRGDVYEASGYDGRTVHIGALPVRTMNLPDSFLTDQYGKRYIYAMTEALADPDQYDNDLGGITVRDASGGVLTQEALYVFLSQGGTGEYDNCDTGMADGENCDRDADFLDGELSLSQDSGYYDDRLAYSTFEPQTPEVLCGTKGMIYAPGHSSADDDSCIDLTTYKKHQTVQFSQTPSVTCTVRGGYCDGEWTSMTTLTPGEYMIHWNAYMKYANPQPSQYGEIEFRLDGKTAATQRIPVLGNECNSVTDLQHEKGVVEISADSESDLEMRLRYYGGEYESSRPGCSGDPAFFLAQAGYGSESAAKKSLTLKIMRRYGSAEGGTEIEIVGESTNPAAIASVQDVEGGVSVSFAGGGSDTLSDGDTLESGDTVITDSTGTAEIHFFDGTKFAMAEDSEFLIDDYEYDAGTVDGHADVTLVQGVFHYISGLIDEENVNIETEYGSIGIRGTEILILHEPGVRSLIQLIDGEIEIEATGGDRAVLGNKFDYAELRPSAAPVVNEDAAPSSGSSNSSTTDSTPPETKFCSTIGRFTSENSFKRMEKAFGPGCGRLLIEACKSGDTAHQQKIAEECFPLQDEEAYYEEEAEERMSLEEAYETHLRDVRRQALEKFWEEYETYYRGELGRPDDYESRQYSVSENRDFNISLRKAFIREYAKIVDSFLNSDSAGNTITASGSQDIENGKHHIRGMLEDSYASGVAEDAQQRINGAIEDRKEDMAIDLFKLSENRIRYDDEHRFYGGGPGYYDTSYYRFLDNPVKPSDASLNDDLKRSEREWFVSEIVQVTEVGTYCPGEIWSGNGHCYWKPSGKKNWEDAAKYCEIQGGHLVTILSEDEDNFVHDRVAKVSNYWIGLSDLYSNPYSYRWITNEFSGYENWHDGEPNSYAGHDKERCVEVSEADHWGDNGLWNNRTCGGKIHFVCESK